FAPALAKLRELMADDSAQCRLRAACAVYTLEHDPTAIAIVRELMEGRDTEHRALGCLLALARTHPELIEDLRAICRKGGVAAHFCLLSLKGHEPKVALAILSESLTHEDQETRWVAAQELGRLGPEAKSAVPMLIKLLDDRHAPVRMNAAKALSKIDPERYAQ